MAGNLLEGEGGLRIADDGTIYVTGGGMVYLSDRLV
jgi:hypothetical protein